MTGSQLPVIEWKWRGEDRANCMDPFIYSAVHSGDTAIFHVALNQHPELIGCLDQVVSPREDTVLHIAARLNHTQLLEDILDSFPALYLRLNSKKDNPLHVAAAAGHLPAVHCLIRERESDQLTVENIELVLKSRNKRGNTALHEAIQKHNYEVAELLFTVAPELSYSLNSDNVYPLYMAAEAGNEELVELMLQYIVSIPDYQNPDGPPKIALLKEGDSLVHAAIRNRNRGTYSKPVAYIGYFIYISIIYIYIYINAKSSHKLSFTYICII
ncbi:hypothetical protein NMG60_11002467 [Bertholletia excelsa]